MTSRCRCATEVSISGPVYDPRLRGHVVQRRLLLREERGNVVDDVEEAEDGADDLASPGLPSAERRAVGVHDFHFHGHLAERLPACCEHERLVDDRGEAHENEAEIRKAVRWSHRRCDEDDDDRDHQNEPVDELGAEAPPDAGEIELPALYAGPDVEDLFTLARRAIRLAADVDETALTERRSAARAAAYALRHIDVIPAQHLVRPLFVWCAGMLHHFAKRTAVRSRTRFSPLICCSSMSSFSRYAAATFSIRS